jgi:hypothetical protein
MLHPKRYPARRPWLVRWRHRLLKNRASVTQLISGTLPSPSFCLVLFSVLPAHPSRPRYVVSLVFFVWRDEFRAASGTSSPTVERSVVSPAAVACPPSIGSFLFSSRAAVAVRQRLPLLQFLADTACPGVHSPRPRRSTNTPLFPRNLRRSFHIAARGEGRTPRRPSFERGSPTFQHVFNDQAHPVATAAGNAVLDDMESHKVFDRDTKSAASVCSSPSSSSKTDPPAGRYQREPSDLPFTGLGWLPWR